MSKKVIVSDGFEKLRMYVLSGGPQDLSNLYLPSLKDVQEFIENDIAEMPDAETEGLEYTLEVRNMTHEEIDALPEYEF